MQWVALGWLNGRGLGEGEQFFGDLVRFGESEAGIQSLEDEEQAFCDRVGYKERADMRKYRTLRNLKQRLEPSQTKLSALGLCALRMQLSQYLAYTQVLVIQIQSPHHLLSGDYQLLPFREEERDQQAATAGACLTLESEFHEEGSNEAQNRVVSWHVKQFSDVFQGL